VVLTALKNTKSHFDVNIVWASAYLGVPVFLAQQEVAAFSQLVHCASNSWLETMHATLIPRKMGAWMCYYNSNRCSTLLPMDSCTFCRFSIITGLA